MLDNIDDIAVYYNNNPEGEHSRLERHQLEYELTWRYLNQYLPAAMSAEELAGIVRETIAEVGAITRAQMGAVMKALGPKIAGRADGRTLSQEVQKQLRG